LRIPIPLARPSPRRALHSTRGHRSNTGTSRSGIVRAVAAAWLIVSAFGAIGCTSSVPVRTGSTGEAVSRLPSVDQVLAAYYEAIGGYDRLKGVRVRRMEGVYREGKLVGPTEIIHERPNLRRVTVHAGAWDHYEGYDGAAWEFHRDSGKVGHLTRVKGEAELAILRGVEFDESFVDYGARGFQASLIGRESVQGLDVYRVRITRTDDWVVDYLFDVHSHLLVALQKAMPLHAEGAPITSLTLYQDWRFVSGLFVPFSGVEINLANGEMMSSLHWNSIAFNGPVDRAELMPPTR
jgi:hypothetical protein